MKIEVGEGVGARPVIVGDPERTQEALMGVLRESSTQQDPVVPQESLEPLLGMRRLIRGLGAVAYYLKSHS